MRMRCLGNPFAEQLPSGSQGIIDVFTGRYQATHIPTRDRCIATAIHAAIILNERNIENRQGQIHVLFIMTVTDTLISKMNNLQVFELQWLLCKELEVRVSQC
jgi:hypothetical protein